MAEWTSGGLHLHGSLPFWQSVVIDQIDIRGVLSLELEHNTRTYPRQVFGNKKARLATGLSY